MVLIVEPYRGESGAWASVEGATDPALDELREAYQRGRLLVVAGSNISTAAGLPAWRELVEVLAARARFRGATQAALQEIARLVSQERRIDALSAARAALGSNEFCTVVERLWSDTGYNVPPIAAAIAALAPQLSGLITTTVDHLLERAFGGCWPVLVRTTADLAQRRRYILKLHGTLVDRSTWVLTRDEHDRLFHSDAEFQRTLSAVVDAHTVVFVGHELASDEHDWLFAPARARSGGQAPRHFGLVPDGSIGPGRRHALEAAGMRIVSYRDQDGGHAAAASLLRGLATAGFIAPMDATSTSTPSDLDASPARAAHVEEPVDPKRLRVQIEETFTFEELETFFADSFPDIRGGIASIVSPVHNAEYRAFKLVKYFERRNRLRDLQSKIQEHVGQAPQRQPAPARHG
ncbi:SIR2 family NAD-dependent protein deacylase [Sorangium sp. So ce385]|uniref:SIR2 family NAD-dependent protein deacylase n=1 Tax=Sorangium sp. So ce385 TaxID=3133308 RepID=UPI003F5C1124